MLKRALPTSPTAIAGTLKHFCHRVLWRILTLTTPKNFTFRFNTVSTPPNQNTKALAQETTKKKGCENYFF
jgi:hypothetical protein